MLILMSNIPHKLMQEEQAFHTDLALAWAQRSRKGEALTFREISELTGMKIERVQKYYESGMKKMEKMLREEMNGKG